MPGLRWLISQIPRESILACSFSGMEMNNRVSATLGVPYKFIPLHAKNREFILAESSPSFENLINSKLGAANRLTNNTKNDNFYLFFIQKFNNWFYGPHIDIGPDVLDSSLSEKYLDEIGISPDAKVCKVWFNDGDTILIKFTDGGMEFLFCHYYYH